MPLLYGSLAMSLINDALKKAQKERAQQQPSGRRSLLQESPSPASSPTPAKSQTQNTALGLPWFKLLFGLIIAGSTLASAIAFMVFLYVQVQSGESDISSPSASPSPEPATVSIVPSDPDDGPSPDSNPSVENREMRSVQLSKDSLAANLDSAPTLSANKVTETPPTSEPSAADPPPATATGESPVLTDSRETAEDPAPTPTSETPAPASLPGDEPLDPALVGSPKAPSPSSVNGAPRVLTPDARKRIEDYIRNASVTGIRLSGPDSKVVLNNRVYRLQELVLDLDLHLMIVGIQKSLITFEDEYGSRYTKRF